MASLVMSLILLSLGGLPLARPSNQPLAQYWVTIIVLDQSPQIRAVSSAPVTITRTDVTPNTIIYKTTAANGEVAELLDEGTYEIGARSPVALYGKAAQSITNSTLVHVPLSSGSVEVRLPICDARIRLLSPSGSPLPNADVVVGGVHVGMTGSDGSVMALSIPKGSFNVAVSLYGQDISPTAPLTVTASTTFTMTAGNMARLQIQIVSALNQGLAQTNVMVRIGTTTVFTGATDDDGALSLELPYGTYSITASYGGVEATKTVSLTGDTTEKIETGVFIVLLGQSLTLAGFALWAAVILVLLLGVGFFALRRRRKVPLPPPPPP